MLRGWVCAVDHRTCTCTANSCLRFVQPGRSYASCRRAVQCRYTLSCDETLECCVVDTPGSLGPAPPPAMDEGRLRALRRLAVEEGRPLEEYLSRPQLASAATAASSTQGSDNADRTRRMMRPLKRSAVLDTKPYLDILRRIEAVRVERSPCRTPQLFARPPPTHTHLACSRSLAAPFAPMTVPCST